jgi:hypothetical protein
MPQRIICHLMQTMVLSKTDYNIGLLTLSTTQVTKLERIKNEAMRTVMVCPKGTSIAAIRYLLKQPTIKTRHKCAQIRKCIQVNNSKSHPLHIELSAFKGKQIKRGKSWMAEAEDIIKLICNPQEIEHEAEWIEMKDWLNLTKVHINLSLECRNWVSGETESILNDIVLQHSHPGDFIIYTDGSLIRGEKAAGALWYTFQEVQSLLKPALLKQRHQACERR